MAIKKAKETELIAETKQAEQEDKYSAAEIIAGYKTFGVPKEIVMATMKTFRITSATFKEATALIKKFNEMGVK